MWSRWPATADSTCSASAFALTCGVCVMFSVDGGKYRKRGAGNFGNLCGFRPRSQSSESHTHREWGRLRQFELLSASAASRSHNLVVNSGGGIKKGQVKRLSGRAWIGVEGPASSLREAARACGHRSYQPRTSRFRTGCSVLVLWEARRRGEPMMTGHQRFGGRNRDEGPI